MTSPTNSSPSPAPEAAVAPDSPAPPSPVPPATPPVATPDDVARLAVLRDYQVIGTAPEPALDDLARLAAYICDTPMALIGFLDADRIWVKGTVGVERTEIRREEAICTQVVQEGASLVIDDLSHSPRFADHPKVTGQPGLRFYAGVPLLSPEGVAIGALCVMDLRCRALTSEALAALVQLSRQVVTHLELRRNLRQLEREVAEHEQTEQALRAAEQRFRSIFENSTEGIFQSTIDGHYLAVNPRLAQIYGYESAEQLMRELRDIGHQLYVGRDRRLEFHRLMQQHGEVTGFESRVRQRDGRIIWISENARSVRDDHGRLLYYEGTVVDITDRKQAEQARQDSERLYHSLVKYLPQNIFRKDTEGRFTFVNELFAQTIGQPSEAIIGRTDLDFFPANLAASYQADDRQVMHTGVSIDKVESHIRADGTRMYVHVLKTPLRDAKDRVIGVQGIFWDETERHRIEQELAYERDLLAALLDHMPDAIYFKDRDSRFLRASKALAGRFGLSDPAELVGRSDADFFSEEHARQAYTDEQAIIRTGQPVLSITERETWPDGRESWVLTTKMPFRDRDGTIIGTFGVSRDITKLIEIERELERARDAALETTRLKNLFLGNISHELRTPLHSIIAGADLLAESPLRAEQRELLDGMRRQAEWQLHMINDLIELSRAEAHRLKLECHDFDPEEIVADTVERLAESALRKGLELVVDVEPALPRLHGDPFRIQQILINLLANSIKFTDTGHVLLQVRLRDSTEAGVTLHLLVQDTGIGIPAEAQARIFEAFEQADTSTTRRYGGTGLGLAICRQLVEAMGGTLSLTSRAGQGATFEFTLLLQPASSPPPQPLTPPADLSGMRLLLVEDHDLTCRILEQRLTHWGCQVQCARTAGEARALAAQAAAFDGVLVDETLPDAPGRELAVRLLAAAPKVALMASIVGRLDLAANLPTRALQCLPKPPSARCLRRLLEAWHTNQPLPPDAGITCPNTPPAQPLRVLVAEDNDFNREIAVQQLLMLGHRPVAVAHGKEVLAELEASRYDVLLLDCQMPELDGYATTRAIRERESHPSPAGAARPPVYIVAVTANTTDEDRARCLASGMNDFLGKPVVRATLDAALRRAQAALQRPSSTGPTPPPPDTEPGPADPLDTSVLDTFDPDTARELIQLFQRTSRELLERLHQAARAKDALALQTAAHSLKGSARHLGAHGLGQLAAEIEELARQPDLPAAAARLDPLTAEYQRVQQHLERSAAPTKPVPPLTKPRPAD